MVSRGGANLVKRAPAFSRDGKRLLVCTACTVTVYSVQTGEVITVLKGHTGVVTSVVVVPLASICHCWTAGMDGTARFWDFAAGALIRTVEVGHPIVSMVIPALCTPWGLDDKSQEKKRPLIGFMSVSWKKEGKEDGLLGRVISHDLATGQPIKAHLGKTEAPRPLFVSPGGGLVGMTDVNRVWIWMVPQNGFKDGRTVPNIRLHHTKHMTILAFDSSETRVAAGDVTGRILIWENVGDRAFASVGDGAEKSEKKTSLKAIVGGDKRQAAGGVRKKDDAAALTTYHWHATEVKSLLFTVDGVYLMSGGMEGVLVMWQLETGKRNYLPRLGGPLAAIAPSINPSLYAIACEDNSVKLLNIGTMEVERHIQGIFPSFPTPKSLKLPPLMVSIDPVEGNIVIATHNLSLQFYDIASDKHIAEVQVTPRNYVIGSRDEMGDDGPSTCVTHVAFSADGSCLATVDLRIAQQGIGGGACLKFWERQSGKSRFTVNTLIDEPHDISALSFHPSELMAVTCSDTNFKVWVPQVRKSSKFSWRCRSVGTYRGRPMLAAAFSPDGSLLAVAASELVTLWNPDTNSLVRVLSNTFTSSTHPLSPIHHLAFVKQSNCLVTGSSHFRSLLTVWDLSTLSVRWSVSTSVESLTVDPDQATFAVLIGPSRADPGDRAWTPWNTDGVIALFDVQTPSPLQYWTVRDAFNGVLMFNPVSQPLAQITASNEERSDRKMIDSAAPSKKKLTYVTGSREFVVFNPYQSDEEQSEQEQPVARNVTEPEDVASGFTALYGKSVQPKKNLDASAEVLSALSRAPWGTLLDGPSHVLPSLSVVGIPFMDSLMKKRTEQT